ncbi:hypothetical protein LIPSTDRAFT_187160 [Lipomyces starkeyi NRRL Y-11557]|uniref:Uncharacterized protein n=1 Tax=Lipomyces starkeyi NRRL Y-11557 TaxID=675824 RepID=A0A1E3PVJ0_LIPST|nr:hypothetical protein LIPSTDRAFT_187160 [Lipomyces starkeyi NRRL Y-11557]
MMKTLSARVLNTRNTPTNQRTAVALKAFYENTVYPEFSGRIERMNISLTTVTDYLRKCGFSLGRHTKDVYFDGHERHDVVQYRQQWAKRMIAYRSQMNEYDGRDDEWYFHSNDDNAITWTERGESIIKKKGQGLGLMVSDFYCACHGPLRFE